MIYSKMCVVELGVCVQHIKLKGNQVWKFVNLNIKFCFFKLHWLKVSRI